MLVENERALEKLGTFGKMIIGGDPLENMPFPHELILMMLHPSPEIYRGLSPNC
jgi:hypothetical protein